MWKKLQYLITQIIFPKQCLFCKGFGNLLCSDCQCLLEISSHHHPDRSFKYLNDVYSPCSYDNKFVKKIIHNCKYAPFYKELTLDLTSVIVAHFNLLDKKPDLSDTIIIPVPLSDKRVRWRGFNQAEMIARGIGNIWQLPIGSECLIKITETGIQAELSRASRHSNIKNAFFCPDNQSIKNRNIILVDDVITTGATMEECAKVLRKNGARQIIGIAVARTEKP